MKKVRRFPPSAGNLSCITGGREFREDICNICEIQDAIKRARVGRDEHEEIA